MKLSRKAFTLIELLVVVLIIGILAAVAVPQYQRVVKKSKVGQIISLVRTLANAQDIYFITNGEYATSWEELDVSVPPSQGECISSLKGYTTCQKVGAWEITLGKLSIEAQLEDILRITSYLKRAQTGDEAFSDSLRARTTPLVCIALGGNDEGHSICKSLGGKQIDDTHYYNL